MPDPSAILSHHGITYRLTPRLRWRSPTNATTTFGAPSPVLEQCWHAVETAPDLWLPVPTEPAEPDAA